MQHFTIYKESNFISVYKCFLLPLTQYAKSLLDDSEEAEEIVNDVFVKILKQRKSFNSEKEMTYYVIACTRNACYNRLKSIKRRKCKQHEALQHFTRQHIVHTIEEVPEANVIVMQAVTALDVQYRSIVWQYYYENRSCAEIAQILKLSIATVRYRLRTGRKLVKEAVR